MPKDKYYFKNLELSTKWKSRLSAIMSIVLLLLIGGSFWYYFINQTDGQSISSDYIVNTSLEKPIDHNTQKSSLNSKDDFADKKQNLGDEETIPQVITEERVLADATYFLHLIKEKDIETLVELWFSLYAYKRPTLVDERDIDIQYPDIDKHMLQVVETFHELLDFDSDNMVEVNYYNPSKSEFSIDILNLRSDIELSEGTAVDSQIDYIYIYYYQDQPYFQQLLFEYYPFAYESMLGYVQAIQEEDLWALGWFFAGHGAQYPDEFYYEIINNYKKMGIDIPSMTPVLTKFDPIDLFVIDITDKNGFTHQINITYRSGHGDRQIVDVNIPPLGDWILSDH